MSSGNRDSYYHGGHGHGHGQGQGRYRGNGGGYRGNQHNEDNYRGRTVSRDNYTGQHGRYSGSGGGGGGHSYGHSNDRRHYNHHQQNDRREYSRDGREGGESSQPSAPRQKGNMIPHQEEYVSNDIKQAKLLFTALSDYTTLSVEEEGDIVTNIQRLAGVLLAVGNLGDDLSTLMMSCLSKMPIQAPALSSVLALMGRENLEFASLVVRKLSDALLAALHDGDINVAKIILRSLCCLASAHSFKIEGAGGLLEVFEMVLNLSYSGWESEHHLRGHSQIATYLLATSMPHIANVLVEVGCNEFLSRAVAHFARVVNDYHSIYRIENICAIFHSNSIFLSSESRVKNLSVGPEGDSAVQCWDTLWESCKLAVEVIQLARATSSSSGKGGGFVPPKCSPHPWADIEALTSFPDTELPAFEARFLADLESKFQYLSQIIGRTIDNLSNAHMTSWLYPIFAIFDEDSSTQVAVAIDSMNAVERISAAQHVRDIVRFFAPIIRSDGTSMGSVDLLSSHLLAICRLYPELVDRSKPYINHIIIETLLQMLLRTPIQTTVNSLIYRVVLEMCRKDTTIPPILASATTILFQFVNDLDSFCVKEFANWFSFHLLNTKFGWPYWDFFVSEYESSEITSQTRLFLAFVLDKCGRAALQESIRTVVPEGLYHLLPVDPTPQCAHLLEGSLVHPDNVAGAEDVAPTASDAARDTALEGEKAIDAATAASLKSGMTVSEGFNKNSVMEKLLSMVEAKNSADDIEAFLDEIEQDEVDMSDLGSHWKLVALVQVIFSISKTTLSSVGSLFDRYLNLLRSIAESEEDQLALIEGVVEVVGHETGMIVNTLDMLLRRSIVQPSALALWLSQPSQLARLSTVNGIALYSIAETLIDRCAGLIGATVSYRRGLNAGGRHRWTGVSAVEGEDSSDNSSNSGTSNGAAAAVDNAAVIEAEDTAAVTIGKRKSGIDDDDDDDDDNGRGRSRRRNREDSDDEKDDHRNDSNDNDDVAANDNQDDEDNGDDDNQNRSKRRKRGADADVSTGEATASAGKSNSSNSLNNGQHDRGTVVSAETIELANETVTACVHSVHSVYVCLLSALLTALYQLDQSDSAIRVALLDYIGGSSNDNSSSSSNTDIEDELRHGWQIAIASIALRLSRSLHSTQAHINSTTAPTADGSKVIFCDPKAIAILAQKLAQSSTTATASTISFAGYVERAIAAVSRA